MNLSPIHHKESFLADISLLKVRNAEYTSLFPPFEDVGFANMFSFY